MVDEEMCHADFPSRRDWFPCCGVWSMNSFLSAPIGRTSAAKSFSTWSHSALIVTECVYVWVHTCVHISGWVVLRSSDFVSRCIGISLTRLAQAFWTSMTVWHLSLPTCASFWFLQVLISSKHLAPQIPSQNLRST